MKIEYGKMVGTLVTRHPHCPKQHILYNVSFAEIQKFSTIFLQFTITFVTSILIEGLKENIYSFRSVDTHTQNLTLS